MRFLRSVLDSLLAGGCYLCRGPASGGEILCKGCRLDLPAADFSACPRCALPSPAGQICGRCLTHPPAYDSTIAAFVYGFPADVLVQGLKLRGELALAAFFAEAIASRIGLDDVVDRIIAVPASRERLRTRGFNQALEIARILGERLKTRCETDLLERVRDSPPQAESPWQERARNVRGAFRCGAGPVPARIAVVDDVMTTGATLHEIAAELKRAGARRVVNWVVSRALPPGEE